MMEEKSTQPIYAEVVSCVGDQTLVMVHVFGRRLPVKFIGSGHHDAAVVWTNTWNEDLAEEWMEVRGAVASMMQRLVNELRKRGVAQNEIDAAVEKLQAEHLRV